MSWFNWYGLLSLAVILIPNVVFAVKCRDGFTNTWHHPLVELLEQIGRIGCFTFLFLNIPGTCFGWPSEEAFFLYLVINTLLIALYCGIWIICFRKPGRFRALSLSILPSAVFLCSGILSRSILLTLAALLFGPCHILISWKNAERK